MGLRKQSINNFILPTWVCAAGFNNNNDNNKKNHKNNNSDTIPNSIKERKSCQVSSGTYKHRTDFSANLKVSIELNFLCSVVERVIQFFPNTSGNVVPPTV